MGDDVERYAKHTRFSDPGRFRERWSALPDDAGVAEIAETARNLIVHFRADGIEVPTDRRGDVDARWVARILELDARRHPEAISVPRARAERVAGCCRDFSLVTVSALRERGVPARSRVGFAGYLGSGFHHDHVVVEWWDGVAWVRSDPQLDPLWFGFDPLDLERGGLGGFATAAEAWLAVRSGTADERTFGVRVGSPLTGLSLVFDYVIRDVAALEGDELLLWDVWGGMRFPSPPDASALHWMDELAHLVVDVDAQDEDASRALHRRYQRDDRLAPRGRVAQSGPYGETFVTVDLLAAAP